MFIRVLHLEMKPERWEEALARFRSTTFPDLERQPGFMRVILGAEPETGRAALITMWQSPEHARTYLDSGNADRLLHEYDEMYARPPQIEEYPVLFDREF